MATTSAAPLAMLARLQPGSSFVEGCHRLTRLSPTQQPANVPNATGQAS